MIRGKYMKKVKIGIIGTGVGLRTLLPGFRTVSKAEVIAICGSTPERSEFFADKFNVPIASKSYKELCENEEIDLICVATPNNLHFEQVKYAINLNKHVLCEKPLVCSREQLNELVRGSYNTDKYCIIDHQLRFNPYLVKIKTMIEKKNLGDIYFVRIHQQSMGFADPNVKWSWSFDENQNGGVRWAMGVHFADLLLYWFNEKMYNISGSMHPVITHRIDNLGNKREIKTSTLCTASMISESGISINLSVSAAAFSKPRFDIDIYGTRAEIHFDLDNKLQLYFSDRKENMNLIDLEGVFDDERKNQISIFSGSFRYFAPNIVSAIAENDECYLKNAAKFKDAIYTFDILEGIKKSVDENCIINPMQAKRDFI